VGKAALARIAEALAHHQGHDQGRYARADVNHDAAREVEHAHLGHPAAVAPNPVGQGIVDQGRPQQREQRIGRELEALGVGARDERRRDDGEHHLIGEEQHVRNGVALPWRQIHTAHEREGQTADEPAVIGTVGQRVPEEHPLQGHESQHHEAVHERGEDILGADQAPVEEGQARHHEQHEPGRDQDPRGIAGIDHVEEVASLKKPRKVWVSYDLKNFPF
jgi:hypothetical protein